MMISIEAHCNPRLPRLAWIAKLPLRDEIIAVEHGTGVECGEQFVVEGCWDATFNDLAFHRSACFCGSGLVVDDGIIHLVPSRSLTDRLLILRNRTHPMVSNSLLLLLAACGARLDEDIDYSSVCPSIIAGIDKYARDIPVRGLSDSKIEQIYYRPHTYSKGTFSIADTLTPRSFPSYQDYFAALNTSLSAITSNLSAKERSNRMHSYTTTSTGYDSTAVSALARNHGVTETFATCGDTTLDGGVLEDGTQVAQALQLHVTPLRPRIPDADIELLCLAATFDGRESVFIDMFKCFQDDPNIACLWAGYHGDKIWDRASSGKYCGTDIRRGDTSGLNLSEVRLQCGFINLSIPFLFASSVKDVVTIANSLEMAPWHIGGDYDRPIPRRIAEEHGVPRAVFGRKKLAIMEYYTYPRHPELRQQFFNYLSNEQHFGPLKRYLHSIAEQVDYRLASFASIDRLFGERHTLRKLIRPGSRNLSNTLYVWATNRATEDYRLRLMMTTSDTIVGGQGQAAS